MNIKPFNQFFLESDEFRLLKDLEDLGANERTWTRDEIQDALSDLDWAGNFEVVLVDPNNFEYSFSEFQGLLENYFEFTHILSQNDALISSQNSKMASVSNSAMSRTP